MEEPPPDTGKGARGNGGARHSGVLPDALLRYLEARGVLLSLEGQEAAQHLLCVVFRGVLAAIFGFTGWLLLMAGLVSFLALGRGWPWTEVTAAVGLVNLVVAAAFAFAASRRIRATRWFEHTLGEFGKDRAWLEQLNEKR
jgi:uncharacterized membrane protein YqjE